MNLHMHRPDTHGMIPIGTIGALSILLTLGLSMLGLLARLDEWIGGWIALKPVGGELKYLPDVWRWLVAFVFAFGLPYVILHVARPWQRVVLWISATILVIGWAPVLCLANFAPEIAAPTVAVMWSGVCALVYARNHPLPSRAVADRI